MEYNARVCNHKYIQHEGEEVANTGRYMISSVHSKILLSVSASAIGR